LLDVAPTVLDLIGAAAEPRFEGRSLRPLIAGAPGADVIGELRSDSFGKPTRHTLCLVRGSRKVLVRPGPATETYDLARDPAESQSAGGKLTDDWSALLAALLERESQIVARAGTRSVAQAPSPKTQEKLRALGYVH